MSVHKNESNDELYTYSILNEQKCCNFKIEFSDNSTLTKIRVALNMLKNLTFVAMFYE